MKTKEWIEFISTQLLQYVFVIGFFIVLWKLIESGHWTTVDNLIGSLVTIVVMIAAYKWGSSAGSAKKTQILADQQKSSTDKLPE